MEKNAEAVEKPYGIILLSVGGQGPALRICLMQTLRNGKIFAEAGRR